MAEDIALNGDWLRVARLAALGVIGPGDLLGTGFVDLFQGANGGDALNGTVNNDVLVGGSGDDKVTGGGGSDLILSGPGADTIATGPGADVVFGTLEDLNGDRIVDFGVEDFLAVSAGTAAFPDRPPLSIPTSLWPTGVPFIEGLNSVSQYDTESLGRHKWDWLFVERGTGADAYALCSLEPLLPSLSEGVSVDPASINGVVNEPFLTGDSVVHFSVTLQSAISAFNNTLGYYRVGSDGTIKGVDILFANTHGSGPTTVTLATPGSGEQIGFFIIQNGASQFGDLGHNLAFVAEGGGAASANGGPVFLQSATLGILNGATIFHSVANLNPDGAHVLSGVAPGGHDLQMGFEDLARATGDNDFQDVVISVRAMYDSII